jgi:hypothetical protein
MSHNFQTAVDALDGARLVKAVPSLRVFIVWFGPPSTQAHVLDEDFREIDVFSWMTSGRGSLEKQIAEAEAVISRHIARQDVQVNPSRRKRR